MTWTSDNWEQDDSAFYGYPLPLNCSAPVPYDRQNVRTFWIFDNTFYGYPHISSAPVPYDHQNVRTFWIFDDAFYGYPHVMKLKDDVIPKEVIDNMYHSLIFYNADGSDVKHTYDDWGLIPTSRPSFSPPEFTPQKVTIPGRNGEIDVTTALTKYPTFGNRSGSIEFLLYPDYEPKIAWARTYSRISNYLHGELKRVMLVDDPAFYYEGRFTVDDFKSGKNYSTITINYDLQPFKVSKWSTIEEWEEDPFELRNLEEPIDISSYFKDLEYAPVDGEEYHQVFNSINIPEKYRQEIIGQDKTVPTLIITPNDQSVTNVDVWFENEELGITYIGPVPAGESSNPEIVFSMFHVNNGIRLAVKGTGKISIKYNVRSL